MCGGPRALWDNAAHSSKQAYFPHTAVLVTRFFTADGLGQVVDFMPPGSVATDIHRLVRILQCVRGRITFEVELSPRFGYGRQPHRTEVTENGAIVTADGMRLVLHAVREPDDGRLVQGAISSCRRLGQGRPDGPARSGRATP